MGFLVNGIQIAETDYTKCDHCEQIPISSRGWTILTGHNISYGYLKKELLDSVAWKRELWS